MSRTELNVFIMYSFTMILGSSKSILSVMNLNTVWIADSATPLSETPSWIGDNMRETA